MGLKDWLTGTKNSTKDIKPTQKKFVGVNNSYIPNVTYSMTGVPVWRNLSESLYLLKCYMENPIVQAVINIKADAFSNIIFKVKNSKGEIVNLVDYDADGGKLKKLLLQPNPMQSKNEWLKQMKVNRETFGNAYIYGSVPVGFEKDFSYQRVTVLNNLPPYCMAPVLTGNWMDAETKAEIISEYKFTWLNASPKTMHTNTILHLNETNIQMDANFTEGRSKLVALRDPISNIDASFESRNVLITRRGALGILTSEKKDAVMGTMSLEEDEVDAVQEEFKKYGTMQDQYSQIISPVPLKYTKMAMSTKDLMLFEEVESNAIAIANSFGVPEILVKYYLKGGTFKNLDASEKRLYDSTIIPEATDFITGLNTFLNTEKEGIQIIGSFDHLHVLQINKKEEAETVSIKEKVALSSFKIGAITFNDYLLSIGREMDIKFGELRVWDLDEKQLLALGIVTAANEKTSDNGNE
jgi:HK97 family phage portal protein